MTARWGRGVYVVVVVSLLAAMVIAVRQVDRPVAGGREVDPAAVFSCAEEQNELDLMLQGLASSLLSGANLFTFQGLAPPGVPVAGGGTTDPDTGGTRFSRTIGSIAVGDAPGVDFFDEAQVPGAEGDELVLGLEVLGTAGADGDDLGLKRLFNQNFGVPDEPGGDVGLLRVDADFSANPAVTALASGFRGAYEGLFEFAGLDGTRRLAGVRIEVNSLAAGAAIPGASTLGFAFKTIDDPDDPGQTFVAVGQRADFAGFDGTTNQPGLALGLDLAVVEPGPVERDLASAEVGWSAAPRAMALGLARTCPDRAQVGWNLDRAGLPDGEAGVLDVDFRLGDRLGQEITVDDGNGGRTRTRASEVTLDGRVEGLPSLMDVIVDAGVVSFTRSGDVAPDLSLERFDLADDDLTRDDELPLHIAGQVTGLARHLLLVMERAVDTGAIQRAELTSWTLSCPGEPPPSGDPAPEDVRRPDLTDTLPPFPGCERHDLAPTGTAGLIVQSWLPEDLDARDATAGLRPPPLDAGQFAYLATRDTNALSSDGLLAFGGRINGLQRATVDLTDAPLRQSRVRAYLEREPAAVAPDDSARFVVDVAPRGTAAGNARVAVDATVADLPDAVRVDYLSGPGKPVDVTWRADGPIAVSGGTLDAQFSGPTGLVVHGAFETGAVGTGPLPPAVQVAVTYRLAPEGDSHGAVYYRTAPDPPGDDFPTPAVPGFDPTAQTRLHAGAELTTAADRRANLATRFHVDFDMPQPIRTVTWDTDTQGRLADVTGDLCSAGSRRTKECAAARFDATVVRGPRTDPSPELLTPPVLPAPTAPVNRAVPAFTEFRPGSGARAVILGPDTWGADVVVKGVARFGYQREPQDIRVQLADTADQPFRINLLDASDSVDVGGAPRPQVLFADAALDHLPRHIRVRQQNATDPDQPWLWVNTENIAIDDIADVDWTTDPAGTRPRLTGVLRLGDAVALRDRLNVADRPTPVRDGSVTGADLWADYDIDNQLLAADASVSIDVPRHVAVWQPTLRHCEAADEAAGDAAPNCTDRPSYEHDEVDDVDVRARTTSLELGVLNLEGGVRNAAHDVDLDARAHVEHVPGTVRAHFTMATNLRLPWATVDLDVEANTPVGAVQAEVFDRNNPVDYQETGRCAADDGDADPCTANYAVSLTNVPAAFHITGRLRAVEDRLTPEPEAPPDPTGAPAPKISVGALGFVHASIDMGSANLVLIDVRDAGDARLAGTLSAVNHFQTGDLQFNIPVPVRGFLNARVDHIEVGFHPPPELVVEPFQDFVVDGSGLAGAFVDRAGIDDGTLGRFLQPLTFILDIAIASFDTILNLLGFGGNLTTDFDLDFDLPLLVSFDSASSLRLGLSGATLSVDEQNIFGNDLASATIAARQQPLANEDGPPIDGAFFHHRNVELSVDGLGGFAVSNDTIGFGDVGLFRHDDCRNERGDGSSRCWHLPVNQVSLAQVSAAANRGGYRSADVLLDFLFTPANHDEFDSVADGEAGRKLYAELAKRFEPLQAEAFEIPDLAPRPVTPEGATFQAVSYCCNETTFNTGGAPEPTFLQYGAVCELGDPTAGPRAVAADGAEYVVGWQRADAVPADKERTFCDATKLVLEAHFPPAPNAPPGTLGLQRWSIALPTPAGMAPGGACRASDVRCVVTASVEPQVDGTVEVTLTTDRFEHGVRGADLDLTVNSAVLPTSVHDPAGQHIVIGLCCRDPEIRDGDRSAIGTVRAIVDASGHPGFHRPEATQVPDFRSATVPKDDDGNASLDPCEIAPDFGCDPLPATHTIQWLYGDGTTSDELTGPRVVSHHYPGTTTDRFRGVLIQYDAAGEVVATAHFSVT